MTTTDNRALGYLVYEAINAKGFAALEKLFDPHVVRHATRETGVESVKTAVTNAFTVFPGKRFVVEDLLIEGDKIALCATIQGITLAQGEPQLVIIEILCIENGHVVEVRGAGTSTTLWSIKHSLCV